MPPAPRKLTNTIAARINCARDKSPQAQRFISLRRHGLQVPNLAERRQHITLLQALGMLLPRL